MICLELFIKFFKIGITTFGGGYAMLPILEREIIDKKNWATKEEILDYYAVSQCTPGIIAVNVATFVGYNKAGILGGIFATLGVVCPSILIITLIAAFIQNFASYAIVKSAIRGLSAAVCAVVIASVIKMGKSAVKDLFGIILMLCGFVLAYFTKISVIIPVLFATILGIIRGRGFRK